MTIKGVCVCVLGAHMKSRVIFSTHNNGGGEEDFICFLLKKREIQRKVEIRALVPRYRLDPTPWWWVFNSPPPLIFSTLSLYQGIHLVK